MPTGIGGETAWWCPSLDDTGNGTTTLYDLIGSNNGTLTNMNAATDWVANTDNGGVRALDFDYVAGPTRQAVHIGTAASVRNQALASISIWVNLQTAPTVQAGIYYESTSSDGFTRFGLFQSTTNQILFVCRDTASGSSFAITATPSSGVWVHVVGTYNANTDLMELFFNGSSVGTNTATKGVLHDSAPASQMCIGAFAQNTSTMLQYSCNALLDDVRIFHKVLSGSEITALGTKRGYQPTGRARRKINDGLFNRGLFNAGLLR